MAAPIEHTGSLSLIFSSIAALVATGMALFTRYKFVTLADCKANQAHCEAHFCRKIDKLDQALERINETDRRLLEFMGKVEQYIKDHS